MNAFPPLPAALTRESPSPSRGEGSCPSPLEGEGGARAVFGVGGRGGGVLPLPRYGRNHRANLDAISAFGNVKLDDNAAVIGFELHRRLVGFDFGEHIAGFDGGAFGDQPFGKRALLHRRRHGGKLDFGHG